MKARSLRFKLKRFHSNFPGNLSSIFLRHQQKEKIEKKKIFSCESQPLRSSHLTLNAFFLERKRSKKREKHFNEFLMHLKVPKTKGQRNKIFPLSI